MNRNTRLKSRGKVSCFHPHPSIHPSISIRQDSFSLFYSHHLVVKCFLVRKYLGAVLGCLKPINDVLNILVLDHLGSIQAFQHVTLLYLQRVSFGNDPYISRTLYFSILSFRSFKIVRANDHWKNCVSKLMLVSCNIMQLKKK